MSLWLSRIDALGRLVWTHEAGFWTPSLTAVDPEIPYLPVEEPTGGGGITADSSVALPFAVSADADVLVAAAGAVGLPLAVSGTAAIPVTAISAIILPFGVSGLAVVAVQGEGLFIPFSFIVAGAGMVAIHAESDIALPFTGTGDVLVAIVGEALIGLPFAVDGQVVLSAVAEASSPPSFWGSRFRSRRAVGEVQLIVRSWAHAVVRPQAPQWPPIVAISTIRLRVLSVAHAVGLHPTREIPSISFRPTRIAPIPIPRSRQAESEMVLPWQVESSASLASPAVPLPFALPEPWTPEAPDPVFEDEDDLAVAVAIWNWKGRRA